MELKKLTEHIWYMPYEEERDRPNLAYVKGTDWKRTVPMIFLRFMRA